MKELLGIVVLQEYLESVGEVEIQRDVGTYTHEVAHVDVDARLLGGGIEETRERAIPEVSLVLLAPRIEVAWWHLWRPELEMVEVVWVAYADDGHAQSFNWGLSSDVSLDRLTGGEIVR